MLAKPWLLTATASVLLVGCSLVLKWDETRPPPDAAVGGMAGSADGGGLGDPSGQGGTGGVCAEGTHQACTPATDLGVCEQATQTCTNGALSACEVSTSSDGTQCDDGNFISSVDECVAGKCQGLEDPAKAQGTIACGLRHACAIRAGGKVYCWGDNASGQLGITGTTSSARAVEVPGIVDARMVTAGNVHTCAMRATGGVLCWGGGAGPGDPRLGRGPSAAGIGEIPGLTATAVSAGTTSTCAIEGGAVKCWGWNDYGVLGNGTSSIGDTPVPVTNLVGATQASLGLSSSHACAVHGTAGAVVCWGQNWYGQLGDWSTVDSSVPVDVKNLAGAGRVSAGANSTCAQLVTGQVECWGNNSSGQIGLGTTTDSPLPTVISNMNNVTSVASGSSHRCALLANGSVSCWGNNASGQLGNPSATNLLQPTAVPGIGGVSALALGLAFTCARLADGPIRCWGLNDVGQLGNGTLASSSTPTIVVDLP
jgi:alpha-tubulin suppressor-like RCC1 family protein